MPIGHDSGVGRSLWNPWYERFGCIGECRGIPSFRLVGLFLVLFWIVFCWVAVVVVVAVAVVVVELDGGIAIVPLRQHSH